MAIARERVMTVAEYLAWEERQELKHEYIDGETIEKPGGTWQHALIGMSVGSALTQRVRRAACRVLNSEMRIKVSPTRFVYADVCVFCENPSFEDAGKTLLNPIVVVEVTSPSSALYDRVDKRGFYLDAPSIEAYLIIDQERPHVELCARMDDGWHVRVFAKPGDVVPLEALGCELPLADVYRGIEWAQPQRE